MKPTGIDLRSADAVCGIEDVQALVGKRPLFKSKLLRWPISRREF
jgi:hypothetical protein